MIADRLLVCTQYHGNVRRICGTGDEYSLRPGLKRSGNERARVRLSCAFQKDIDPRKIQRSNVVDIVEGEDLLADLKRLIECFDVFLLRTEDAVVLEKVRTAFQRRRIVDKDELEVLSRA